MNDEGYMQRALQLAALGLGQVSPNPMVGCVIVHEGRIIGEGYHKKFGGPHAEVEALNQVEDPSLLPNSTAYVSLEPCSHHGKTPPCADLLIEKRLKRVVIGMEDPHDKVSGEGIKRLSNSGVALNLGIMEDACRSLNRRFLTAIEKQRPYLILKWAQTADGFLARATGESKWISNEVSRKWVHKWRTEEDGILVGARTVQADNPKLTAREWQGRQPARIIVDRDNELSSDFHVFDGSQHTFYAHAKSGATPENAHTVNIPYEGFWQALFATLVREGIHSVLVEGGAQVLQSLIDENLWDEIRVFTSDSVFREGIQGPTFLGHLVQREIIEDNLLRIYIPHA